MTQRPMQRDHGWASAPYLDALYTWLEVPENAEAEQIRLRDEVIKPRRRDSLYESQHRKRCVEDMGIPWKDFMLLEKGKLDATEAVRSLESAKGSTVCLSGNPGCGKTTAAAAYLHRAADGLFVKSARLARWDRYDDEEMRRLFRAFILVIDDLGTEFQDAKGNFLSVLDEVIDARYDRSMKTIITTNLDAEQFKARYGERIADRIRESGKFISIGEKSMRAR